MASRNPLPPKGPKVPWPFGISPMNRANPLGELEGWARKYGDIFHWRTLYFQVVFANHPDLIEKILVSESRNYRKGRGLQANREIFGDGLLTSEGDSWLRQRRLMQPAFHRERIAAYADTMIEQGRRLADSWQHGETRDVHADLMRATLEIAGATLFGTSITDSDAAQIADALHKLFNLNSPRRLIPLLRALPTRDNRRYSSAVRQLDGVIYPIIARRRAQLAKSPGATGATHDLLTMLLEARDEDGSRMSDRQLRDESITLLLAGHETTALALTWTLYLLAQNPEVAAQLAAELDATLVGGRAPTLDDVPRLTFTAKVLKESMRLYPPAWGVVRMTPAECTLAGYRIPRGASVIISQWVMHRDPRFFPDPTRFDPARWTDSFERDLPRFAYFPFGGGPRVCIGNSFALMEATLVLAILAQRFRFHVDPTCDVVLQPSITLRPKNGLRLRLESRK